MGAVASKAADAFGGIFGKVLATPFKSVFGGSCEGICSGTWDVTCFVEHLCVSNLVKLLMILGLCFIILMFVYLLFQLGICQCMIRSLCKVCWAGCETYWFALEDITCFLWHKLRNTRRVNRRRRRRRRRRRFQDMEAGYNSSSNDESDYNHYSDNYHGHGHHHRDIGLSKKRDRERSSVNKVHGHGVKLKNSRQVSIRVKGSSRRIRNSQRLQLIKVKKPKKRVKLCNKRRKMHDSIMKPY